MPEDAPQQPKRNLDIRADVDIKADTVSGDASITGFNIGSVTAEEVHIHEAPRPEVILTPQERRNRTAMLDKVEDFWVRGVLNQSLYREARLDLGLADAPDEVEYPWRSVIQRPDQAERALAPGTPLIRVLDELRGSLLTLGEPGAGKTTLLLELARDLIARARADDTHPIPVVFNLSNWAIERKPLKEWLVEELRLRYEVPRKVGEAWVAADNILPLLDGLDEVAIEHRDACVAAINAYETTAPRAVCSRVEDYETLNAKLKLQGAVVIQPLDEQQVDAYLARLGEPVAGVREVLREGPEWRELLETPLMLAIVVLTYRGRSVEELRQAGGIQGLWDAYVERMSGRKGENAKWAREKVEGTLGWLAWQMRKHQETVYYIEGMQPDWLRVNQLRAYGASSAILHAPFGVFVGVLVGVPFGLMVALLYRALGALKDGALAVVLGGALAGVISGAVAGLLSGMVVGAVSGRRTIRKAEVLSWSWSGKVIIGMLAGALVSILVGGSGVLVGALVGGLLGGATSAELAERVSPNQGIRRSVRTALVIGLGVTLFGTLFSSLSFGLFSGLVCGLLYGGRTFLQHYTLRWLLSRQGHLPCRDRDLIALLDHAASLLFLRRVGGGWIFVHRMLLDHLADKYEAEQRTRQVP